MKNLLLLICAIFSCHTMAESAILKTSIAWINDSLPEETLFAYESDGIGFQGCKQREYEIHLAQPLSEHFILDTSVGYAKGQLQWGVFSQQVSRYEVAVVPRYLVSERMSLGLGLVAQTQVEFKTAQGQEFDLPRNNEWLASARWNTTIAEHYWEFTVSSQKWQVTDVTGNWFDRGLANNKVNLEYVGRF